MSRRNLTWLLAALLFCWLCYHRGEHDPFGRYALEGYKKIDRLAYEDVPDRELFQGAMKGMVDVLRSRGDEHSAFLGERRAKRMQSDISQEIDGVGVVLRFEGDPPALQVAGPPLPGKPADRAGMREGDTIVAIDGKPITHLTPADFELVLDMIRGRAGDPLQLTVLHEGEDAQVALDLVRERIEIDSLRGDRLLGDYTWQHLLDQDSRIALVRLTSFGVKSVGELEKLLPELASAGMEAMILDLRGNPGGSLTSAVEVCELFLPAGRLIVETRDRYDKRRAAEFNPSDGPYLDLPLVVLVDRDSASASEIVAACLQDYQRAVVIGERTFGKGTVQELHPMQAGKSMLKLTCASYWRPSGKNIHRKNPDRAEAMSDPDWGVMPEQELQIEMSDDDYIAWAKSRAERDVTVYDPAAEPSDDDLLYDDRAVELAVAYLQELLGHSGPQPQSE